MRCLTLFCLLYLGFHLGVPLQAAAKPPETRVVLAYQPLASPGGALMATLQHDRILRRALARAGVTLQMVPVKSGAEALTLLSTGAAQGSTFGDMPLLKAATEHPLYAIALLKQNYVSVIGPKGMLASDLKGKRIGNAFGTTGHFALMKTLAGSGLVEGDAVLVPMEVAEMEEALLKGKIDAYAAWDPTPELTLSRYPDRFTAIGKQKSLAFIAVSKPLADRSPEIPLQLTAALLRATTWLAGDRKALEQAVAWNLKEITEMKGKQGRESGQGALAKDLRDELAAIGYSPRIPKGVDADGSSLADEFQFLKKLGKIPPTASWPAVRKIFRWDFVERVQKNPKLYQTGRFDYDQR